MVPGGRPDLRGAGGDLSSAPGRTFVVFNPASGRGRGEARIRAYLDLLDTHLPGCEHGRTAYAGEEAELAARAVADGFETVVAVGGDGTWSHVADALLRTTREDPVRRPRLAVLPSGTGNDFARNLGLDYREMEAAVVALASGRTRRIDVGRVRTPCRPDREPEAAPADRFFLNLVGFGFDVAVIDAAAAARFLRGELLYKVTALQQLFRFPGFDAEVRGASGRTRDGPHLMVTVSNGRYFGGGFPIAPDATVQDGRLHACLIGDAPPLTRLGLFNAAQKGRHVESERVEVVDDGAFALTFDAPPRFEVDGDVFVSSGAVVEVEAIAGALEVAG